MNGCTIFSEEIEASCPKLDNGSAMLTSYEADHILAEVDYLFDIPPANDGECGANKEQLLLAIGRAIEKNDVTFAIPTVQNVNIEPATRIEVPSKLSRLRDRFS